jgi:protein-S-isoprenylcysteine O-methyltransferase Ste14
VKLGIAEIVFFVVYAAMVAGAVAEGPRGPLWLAGLTLSLICAVLWVAARRQLGASFSVRPEARRLVTTGLYSHLRHPIYVFGTLAFLLALLALQGWRGFAVWAILIPVQVVRARREDEVLAAAFGADYAAWREQTWF